MSTIEQRREERASGIPAHPERTAGVATVVSGAVLGVLLGIFAAAGLTGAIVGGILGAIAGALGTAYVQRRSRRDRTRNEVLDREIGLNGGDLGRAPPGGPGTTSTA
jgi:F0F1-type ATP synthase assembly protein I